MPEQKSSQPMVNNSTHRTSPRPPLRESASVFDRRGARAKRHGARPPARFSSPRSQQSVKQKQEPRVTPFWHNDTPPRVTVTFGARRPFAPAVHTLEMRYATRLSLARLRKG